MFRETKYGYFIAMDGECRSPKGRLVKHQFSPAERSAKYHRVQFSVPGVPGKTQFFLVHRLVLEEWGDAAFDYALQVRHIDHNPHNNHVSNLRQGTAKQNSDDKFGNGTHPSQKSTRKKS